jgi:uncharacterized protein YfbU (UPF0304 family)
MKKVIRLTESDLMKIVKRVISENEKPHHKYAKMNHGEFMGEIKSLYKEVENIKDSECGKINNMEDKWNLLNRAFSAQEDVERSDEFNLCGAKIRRFKKNKCKK